MARHSLLPATCGWGIWVAAFPRRWFCGVPAKLQQCCASLRCRNGVAWLLLPPRLWAGMAVLRESQAFRDASSSPGQFWCPMAEHGPCKTLYNLLLPQSQPKPREQPLLQPGVPWRHHPWRNLIPDFSLIYLRYSPPIPAERAGLTITGSKKGDYGFEGHWPSLLVLGSCSKQESSSTWSTRRWGGTFSLFLWFGVKSLCGLRNWGACRRGTVTLSSHFHEKLTSFMLEL